MFIYSLGLSVLNSEFQLILHVLYYTLIWSRAQLCFRECIYDEFSDKMGVNPLFTDKLAKFADEIHLHGQSLLFLKHNISLTLL